MRVAIISYDSLATNKPVVLGFLNLKTFFVEGGKPDNLKKDHWSKD